MKIAAILFVIIGCVAISFEEEVAKTNAAAMNEMKSKREKMMEQEEAVVNMIKSRMPDLPEKRIRDIARQAIERAANYKPNTRTNSRSHAQTNYRPHAQTYYRPTSTAQNLERGKQIRTNLQAASPRANFRSMEDIRKQHAEKMNAAQKQEEEEKEIMVDAEAISQHAKMAVERAKSLPSSFQEWEEHIKHKMAAAAKANTHQEVATKNTVQNSNTVGSSSVNRHMSPSHKDLVKEIEVEEQTAAAKPRPYHMPFSDTSEIIKHAEAMYYDQPHSIPLPRKEFEDMVQARIEAFQGNPQKWEEIKQRVEEEKAKWMSPH